MLDPNADAFVPVVLGLTFLAIAGAAALAWLLTFGLPRRQLRRVERLAAAGDPGAIRSMEFLGQLDAAFAAGGPRDAERRDALRRDGRPVRAEIRAVEVGSTRVERGTTAMRPVTLSLRPLGDERELTVTEYVDELCVARLLVGSELTLFVDRLDPAAVTIAWDVV
jgi:hypothetical protein